MRAREKMDEVVIDVVSDVVCPWCYIGKRRLEKAVERLTSQPNPLQVKIRYHPHFLSPQLLKQPKLVVSKRDVYLKRFKGSEEKLSKMVNQFEELFAAEDIEYNFNGAMSHTLHAHRLVEMAYEEYGDQVAGDVVDLLFKYYHSMGKTMSDLDSLLDAAEASGMDREKCKAFLQSERLTKEVLDKVVNQAESFQSLAGVPHFRVTVNKETSFEFPGAQDVSFFERTITKLVQVNHRPKL